MDATELGKCGGVLEKAPSALADLHVQFASHI